jgi:hypothetical protein
MSGYTMKTTYINLANFQLFLTYFWRLQNLSNQFFFEFFNFYFSFWRHIASKKKGCSLSLSLSLCTRIAPSFRFAPVTLLSARGK